MFSEYTTAQKERLTVILKSILNHKRITRNRLADLLKLSPSSIVKYINILMDMGLILETAQQESTGGRRSTFIEMNPAVGLNIAVVISISQMNGVLINTVGEIVAKHTLSIYLGMSRDELLGILYEMLDVLLGKAEGFRKRIFGIGLGIGGHIDPLKGISHEYLYAKDWYDVPLKNLIESKYSIPCFLVNDVNACALGEKYYGMGIGVDHFLCVQLNEGVGMGIVVNGGIYMGRNYYAGEFGHTHAVSDGQLCFCGHTGCLETVTSKQYILSACRAGLKQGVNSEALKYCHGDVEALQIEHVITAANNGDRLARNVFEQVGKYLGDKLADMANIFNPELIILRGPVIDGNRFLLESIERVVMNQSLRHIAKDLKVVHSEERNDIRLMGINSIILIEYFMQ